MKKTMLIVTTLLVLSSLIGCTRQPLELNVTAPAEDITVHNPIYHIKATSPNADTISMIGYTVEGDTIGVTAPIVQPLKHGAIGFEIIISLKKGKNRILITATRDKESTTHSATITYTPRN